MFTTTILALGLYLHSEVQICVSDALSISSSFQSLVGCPYLFLCVALSLVCLISLCISLSAERFSLSCLIFFSLKSVACVYLLCFVILSLVILISFSISLSAERFPWSYFFCLLSLISFSISLSAERFCL